MSFYECREFCREHIALHHFQFTTTGIARCRRYHHRRHVNALKTMGKKHPAVTNAQVLNALKQRTNKTSEKRFSYQWMELS